MNLTDNLQRVLSQSHAAPAPARPRVSVIVAARNNAEYLREALESALAQTVPVEVVYSDDASTDDSVAIARALEPAGLTVVGVARHEGVCAARNRGAAIATGDYLVFLDGDDVLSVDFCERHLEALTASPGAPFAYGPAQAFGDAAYAYQVPAWQDYDPWRQNTVNTSAMYTRWALAAASAGTHEPGHEPGPWRDDPGTMWDWDLSLRAMRFGTPVPSQALLFYRHHAASWSAQTGEREQARRVECAPVIRRLNARLSIGAIVSGRLPNLFPRWLEHVAYAARNIRLSERPELVILDNTVHCSGQHSPGVSGQGSSQRDAMHAACGRHEGAFRTIRILPWPDYVGNLAPDAAPVYVRAMHSHDSIGGGPGKIFINEFARRNEVAKFMARATNYLATQLRGDLHWLVEDDILVPPQAGERLLSVLLAGDNPPHAAAGCYRNRHVPDKYVDGYFDRPSGRPRELTDLPASNEPLPVDFTGTGCLMYWRSRTPQTWHSHLGEIPAHDWRWGVDLTAAGGKLLLLPSVRCGHAINCDHVIPG